MSCELGNYKEKIQKFLWKNWRTCPYSDAKIMDDVVCLHITLNNLLHHIAIQAHIQRKQLQFIHLLYMKVNDYKQIIITCYIWACVYYAGVSLGIIGNNSGITGHFN